MIELNIKPDECVRPLLSAPRVALLVTRGSTSATTLSPTGGGSRARPGFGGGAFLSPSPTVRRLPLSLPHAAAPSPGRRSGLARRRRAAASGDGRWVVGCDTVGCDGEVRASGGGDGEEARVAAAWRHERQRCLFFN